MAWSTVADTYGSGASVALAPGTYTDQFRVTFQAGLLPASQTVTVQRSETTVRDWQLYRLSVGQPSIVSLQPECRRVELATQN